MSIDSKYPTSGSYGDGFEGEFGDEFSASSSDCLGGEIIDGTLECSSDMLGTSLFDSSAMGDVLGGSIIAGNDDTLLQSCSLTGLENSESICNELLPLVSNSVTEDTKKESCDKHIDKSSLAVKNSNKKSSVDGNCKSVKTAKKGTKINQATKTKQALVAMTEALRLDIAKNQIKNKQIAEDVKKVEKIEKVKESVPVESKKKSSICWRACG